MRAQFSLRDFILENIRALLVWSQTISKASGWFRCMSLYQKHAPVFILCVLLVLGCFSWCGLLSSNVMLQHTMQFKTLLWFGECPCFNMAVSLCTKLGPCRNCYSLVTANFWPAQYLALNPIHNPVL